MYAADIKNLILQGFIPPFGYIKDTITLLSNYIYFPNLPIKGTIASFIKHNFAVSEGLLLQEGSANQ
jgi:hypothetical protein